MHTAIHQLAIPTQRTPTIGSQITVTNGVEEFLIRVEAVQDLAAGVTVTGAVVAPRSARSQVVTAVIGSQP